MNHRRRLPLTGEDALLTCLSVKIRVGRRAQWGNGGGSLRGELRVII